MSHLKQNEFESLTEEQKATLAFKKEAMRKHAERVKFDRYFEFFVVKVPMLLFLACIAVIMIFPEYQHKRSEAVACLGMLLVYFWYRTESGRKIVRRITSPVYDRFLK